MGTVPHEDLGDDQPSSDEPSIVDLLACDDEFELDPVRLDSLPRAADLSDG